MLAAVAVDGAAIPFHAALAHRRIPSRCRLEPLRPRREGRLPNRGTASHEMTVRRDPTTIAADVSLARFKDIKAAPRLSSLPHAAHCTYLLASKLSSSVFVVGSTATPNRATRMALSGDSFAIACRAAIAFSVTLSIAGFAFVTLVNCNAL
jgi:hypothetical protein